MIYLDEYAVPQWLLVACQFCHVKQQLQLWLFQKDLFAGHNGWCGYLDHAPYDLQADAIRYHSCLGPATIIF